ncbi:TolC family protein [Litoribacillus peritrichatus]|uniref:TolC family protein n=1 Tax=Litoribacillus peritrichatus TaxID=718191 RepID=A0ABP7MJU3_9GAMM
MQSNKKIQSLVGVLAVILLSGCSTLGQTVSEHSSFNALSDTQVPAQWQRSDSEAVVTVWHDIIQSHQLDGLIAEALANSQDLKATAARWQAARAQAKIATGELLPEVTGSLEGGRSRSSFGEITNQYNLGLDLSWELDIWGRLSDAEQAALMTAQQQQQSYYWAKMSLASQVAIDWLNAIEAKRQFALAEAREKSLKESLAVIEDGFSTGIREALDVYSARAELMNGQTETLEKKQTLNQALRQVSLLLGRYPSLMDDIPDQLPASMPKLADGLSSSLLERRPDVQAAYAEVMSQQSEVLVAGGNRLPRFTLTASVGATSNSLSDVLRGDELIWNALGGITAPVFNAGKLAAEEQRQQYLLEAAIADYRQTALTAFSEVEQAIDSDRLIALQLGAASETVLVSKQAEQQAFESYLAGLENLNTWLQAQRTAFDRTSRKMQLEVLYFQNRIQLHQALGGEFKERSSDGQ